MGVWVLFLLFLSVTLRSLLKERAIDQLIANGLRADAVCEFIKWDEGNASSVCYFTTVNGARAEVASAASDRPLLQPGEMAEVAYDADNSRHAVLLADRNNRRGEMRVVAALFGLASVVTAVVGLIKAFV
ncbi:DUF3592 domain-containing protein [Streptomyces beijiangensis]|uniref:DUF3592 domain-containing protein n=1 Tax=Streptomyces beijiangensis TaxID=163361 RepID=A0A939JES1_9ACTN|nr:DUF3592 domain-containing protein [Streptomyces beijiangensis]MBO0513361.1 hypothetical protein [Streptomyces beijiangensis]